MLRILINPIEEVEKAYRNGDFFVGFILAATYIEYEVNCIMGYLMGDLPQKLFLENLPLRIKLECLSELNRIDRTTYKKIKEIMKIRNRLMHPSDLIDRQGRKGDPLLRFMLNEKEKSFLCNFKECYSKLVQTDFKLFKARAEK